MKRLIEKESENYALSKLNTRTDAIDKFSKEMPFFSFYDIDEAFYDGFNSCLSKWQEAERWRKVEEELPKEYENVIIKTNKGEYHVAYLRSTPDNHFNNFSNEWFLDEVDKWKPLTDKLISELNIY